MIGHVRRAIAGGVAVLALASGLTLAPPAANAQTAPYPPGASVTCPTSTVEPGDTITCSAGGFSPGSEVQVEVLGAGWSATYTVIADADGVARVDIEIPSDAASGEMRITFTGRDAAGDFLRVAVAVLTVTAPDDAARADLGARDDLARTGAPLTRGLAIAVASILLGVIGIGVAWRRV